MMKSAVKEPAPCSGDGEEWLSWKDDTITLFTLAGRRIVLEENFSTEAQKLGWSPQQIADANRFVWTMLKSSVAGTKAANVFAIFAKAPRFDGARTWWGLRRKHEVLGNSVMEKLSQKLTKFAPKATEDPEDMINRFETTLEKCELSPAADLWSDDRKLRVMWKACSKCKALQLKVEMTKSEHTSKSRTPDRLTCPYITNKLIGQWLSFSGDESSGVGTNEMVAAQVQGPQQPAGNSNSPSTHGA
jgi:hypothetical protein